MTRAVDRLVARSRRPPLPVAPNVAGPEVLDAEPFPVSPSGSIAPPATAVVTNIADATDLPARRDDAPDRPGVRRDPPPPAATTPLDVVLDDAAPSRIERAGDSGAAPPLTEPQLEPVDRTRAPGTTTPAPNSVAATGPTRVAGDATPLADEPVARHAVAAMPRKMLG